MAQTEVEVGRGKVSPDLIMFSQTCVVCWKQLNKIPLGEKIQFFIDWQQPK